MIWVVLYDFVQPRVNVSLFGFPELITVHVSCFICSHSHDDQFVVLVLVHGLSVFCVINFLISLSYEVYLYLMLLLSWSPLQLVKLPRIPNVNDILEFYRDYRGKKDDV